MSPGPTAIADALFGRRGRLSGRTHPQPGLSRQPRSARHAECRLNIIEQRYDGAIVACVFADMPPHPAASRSPPPAGADQPTCGRPHVDDTFVQRRDDGLRQRLEHRRQCHQTTEPERPFIVRLGLRTVIVSGKKPERAQRTKGADGVFDIAKWQRHVVVSPPGRAQQSIRRHLAPIKDHLAMA